VEATSCTGTGGIPAAAWPLEEEQMNIRKDGIAILAGVAFAATPAFAQGSTPGTTAGGSTSGTGPDAAAGAPDAGTSMSHAKKSKKHKKKSKKSKSSSSDSSGSKPQ
jgi:hypothetical protein